jgi:beta-glucosidase
MKTKHSITLFILFLFCFSSIYAKDSIESKIDSLLMRMTLKEKIGQMNQLSYDLNVEELETKIKTGEVGSLLNVVDVGKVNELQRIAVMESRLGIPLIVGRDVIHGFKTIFPIPLGQASTFNPSLVEAGARVSAIEAAEAGINWTFAPMIDISRDPRWGRIAESFGEDPYLTGILGEAMIRGFQGNDLSAPGSIAACAKHFAGYGASEGGRDYNSTNIPERLMRNVYLPPFKAAVDEPL